jgi:hypothetical protein
MHEVVAVEPLKARDDLDGDRADCLQCEVSVAELEKLLQVGSQNTHNESIVVTFNAEPVYLRNASY